MASPSSAFIKGWTFNYDTVPSGSAVYSVISEVTEVSGLGQTFPQVDVTSFDSSSKEYIAGLADGAEVSVTCNYLTSDTSHDALIGGAEHGPGQSFDLQFVSNDGAASKTFLFSVVNLGFEITPAIDDKNTVVFNFKISGDITVS